MLKDFRKLWLSKPRLICGIMTGTSMDAVDIALCKIRINDNSFGIDLLNKHVKKMPDYIRSLILDISSGLTAIKDISFLNTALSHLFYQEIKKLCCKSRIEIFDIKAIGIHGQTLWHEPEGNKLFDEVIKYSYQAGCGSTLATLAAVPVVNNFRAADVALGGEGAPLAPIFDYHFLRSSSEDVIALNIGGMANITYMPKNCKKEEVIAFDTGPGNVLIDSYANEVYGKKYDHNGDIARSGKVIGELFSYLQSDVYIIKDPPKSTGREKYNMTFINDLIHRYVGNDRDIIHTFTKFTAWSIAENIKLFANPKSKIFVAGGGRKNSFMMNTLKQYLPEAKIIDKDNIKIPTDIKEAMIFAFLAYLNLGGIPGNMPSVTGATRETILGSVSFPK